jgi:hypothetical protein
VLPKLDKAILAEIGVHSEHGKREKQQTPSKPTTYAIFPPGIYWII